MPTYNYALPFQGAERIIDRPDRTQLRTIMVGSGDRTVVLAHGFGSAADSWNLVAPKLVSKGFRVIAFDQRGHGGSSIGSDGIGSSQMASDYGAVLDSYDLNDVILLGHSMGGFLAITFLLEQNSARVGSLLLLSTFAGDVSRKNPQNRLQIPLIKSGILPRLLRFRSVDRLLTHCD